ncbi:hypothetical protein R3P38DRAFT_286379 [Favolaschia claudopus]|uniref:Uncharacterized protein n=1 Tax=Favolaschia claudopus TaxID=2862362 RepID=A0AAV9ZNE5_9AGAR
MKRFRSPRAIRASPTSISRLPSHTAPAPALPPACRRPSASLALRSVLLDYPPKSSGCMCAIFPYRSRKARDGGTISYGAFSQTQTHRGLEGRRNGSRGEEDDHEYASQCSWPPARCGMAWQRCAQMVCGGRRGVHRTHNAGHASCAAGNRDMVWRGSSIEVCDEETMTRHYLRAYCLCSPPLLVRHFARELLRVCSRCGEGVRISMRMYEAPAVRCGDSRLCVR